METYRLSANAIRLLLAGSDRDCIDRTLFQCIDCNLYYCFQDLQGNDSLCPQCQSPDILTSAEEIFQIQQAATPKVSMKRRIAQSLYELGIIPDTRITKNEPTYIREFVNYVCEAETLQTSNGRIWDISAFLSAIALKMKSEIGVTATDEEIASVVASSARKTHFGHKPVIEAIEDCLCYWTRTDAVQSVGYRFGNLTVALGVIAEAINNPDQ